jgi:hypothetical protein
MQPRRIATLWLCRSTRARVASRSSALLAPPQSCGTAAGPDHVALPVDGAAAMAEILEDIEDAGLYRARAGEPVIPHEVVEAIHKGVHPVRAWRKHKGLTLQELAEAGQMPTGYLSEIETGKKPGSVAAYKSLARALGTGIDMLIAE